MCAIGMCANGILSFGVPMQYIYKSEPYILFRKFLSDDHQATLKKKNIEKHPILIL